METTQESKSFFKEKNINEFRRLMLNPLVFKAGLFRDLPLAAIAGLKISKLTKQDCEVEVTYGYINKNPFGTMYWAVMGMAAEMASGAILLMYIHKLNPSVSTFVKSCESKFIKTATGRTIFRFDEGQKIAQAVYETCQTREGKEVSCKTNALNENGDVLAEFTFVWSIKARKSSK